MATIEERGAYQFRAKVRRNGVAVSRTFESRKEAEEWARIEEGRITGHEHVDRRTARDTTLSQACDWMLKHGIENRPNAKNVRSKLGYWKTSKFANWSLVAIHDWDLIEWRREILDEDAAPDGEAVGAEAICSAQTVIHRLNALSKLFQSWSRAHQVSLDNPVKRGVRPNTPEGRDRRLHEGEETRLLTAARRSSRWWLEPAIVIALETCVRQDELASLTWQRVFLDAQHPYVDLTRTKNARNRRVPLSGRAVGAFRVLRARKATGHSQVLPIETPRSVLRAFREVVLERDFPDLRWHDLRHEGVSRLFERTDYRDHEIMAISGHLSTQMLARYTHLRADRLGSRLPGGSDNPFTSQGGSTDP